MHKSDVKIWANNKTKTNIYLLNIVDTLKICTSDMST